MTRRNAPTRALASPEAMYGTANVSVLRERLAEAQAAGLTTAAAAIKREIARKEKHDV